MLLEDSEEVWLSGTVNMAMLLGTMNMPRDTLLGRYCA